MDEEIKKEKRRAYHRKWKKNNTKRAEYLAKGRERERRRRLENPERIRELQRQKYARNREKYKEQVRQYRKRNREKIYLADKERAKVPQRKLGMKIRIRIWCALHRGKSRKSQKMSKTEELIGITIPELKKYLEKQFKKGMTWENHGKWHIDHRMPLVSFDLTREEEQKKAFHYTNLQPLWAEENLSKGAKILN